MTPPNLDNGYKASLVYEVRRGWRILVEDGVREATNAPNGGLDVEWILKSTGNNRGDPWCASCVYHVGRSRIGKKWPLPRSASCDVLLAFARDKGVVSDSPFRDAVFLRLKSDHDADHTGYVMEVYDDGSFKAWEGNTNEAGSREGTHVMEKIRGTVPDTKRYYFVRWTDLL